MGGILSEGLIEVEPEDDCEVCDVAAAVGMTHKVCKDFEAEDLDCDRLMDDVTSGRMRPMEFVDFIHDFYAERGVQEAVEAIAQVRSLVRNPNAYEELLEEAKRAPSGD